MLGVLCPNGGGSSFIPTANAAVEMMQATQLLHPTRKPVSLPKASCAKICMPPDRLVRDANRPSERAIVTEPPAAMSHPPKLRPPYGASRAGIMKMPVPIMVPTENAQHCQNPMTLACGWSGASSSALAPAAMVFGIKSPDPSFPSNTLTPVR